mmetsp:Transcript_44137/g.123003  ORF Transcript_44137/g.123003 Transcript_44137/m.123003 type:complete len:178 (-) Transcript_44137:100-633(-)
MLDVVALMVLVVDIVAKVVVCPVVVLVMLDAVMVLVLVRVVVLDSVELLVLDVVTLVMLVMLVVVPVDVVMVLVDIVLVAVLLVAVMLVEVTLTVVLVAVTIWISGGATVTKVPSVPKPSACSFVCRDAVKLEDSLAICPVASKIWLAEPIGATISKSATHKLTVDRPLEEETVTKS